MFEITAILDKSTFQQLSYAELLKLTNYYKHNITPVLVMEIIGDLKKDIESNTANGVVQGFAKKLFPTDTIINAHYGRLLQTELFGTTIFLDGRPHVGVQKTVISDTGMHGTVMEVSNEEKAIYKWRDGHFSEADHILSALWRNKTTAPDLLTKMQSEIISEFGKRKLDSFNELNAFIDRHINNPAKQDVFLHSLIATSGLSEAIGVDIFNRWFNEGRPQLKLFTPFAYHCLKVDMFFLFGLQSRLIGPRPTNIVDIEYLYYLPFCHIFASNDKLHKNIAPYLLRTDQKFISGEILKTDLKSIVDYLDKEGEDIRRKYKSIPPVINNSLTFKLWNEFFNYPNYDLSKNNSPEDKDYVLGKMKEFYEATKKENTDFKSSNNRNFFVKKSWLSWNDPCFCGSGKILTKCCISPREFNRIAAEHYQEYLNEIRQKNLD